MSLRELLLTRPACCAAAGFSAVSIICYFAAADADPRAAGAVKLAAAALLFIAAAVFIVLSNRGKAEAAPTPNPSGERPQNDTSHKEAAPARRLYASAAALFFACALAAVLSWLHFGRPARLLENYGEGGRSVTFTVIELERISTYDASYYVEAEKIDGKSLGPGKIYALLEADYILDLEVGAVYTLDGVTLSAPEYGTLSEAAYGASRGLMLELHSADEPGGALQPSGVRMPLRVFFGRLNKALSQRFAMALGKDSGGLAACLLLGRWDSLTGTVSRDFRALGILHLLAISGEHLSILLGGLEILLRGLNKYIRFALLCCGALAIFALTGMSPAVARASVMAVLYYAAFLLRRRADGPTSLFVAVALIIAVNPAAAADVGLLMSACATLGIMAAGGWLSARKKPKNRAIAFLRENFVNSLFATVFTLPVSWPITGELSPAGPLATLIFSLPVTALLYILPLVLIFFGTPLAAPLEIAADVLCGLVRTLSRALAAPLSDTVISLRYPFVWLAFAAAAAVFILLPRIIAAISRVTRAAATPEVVAAAAPTTLPRKKLPASLGSPAVENTSAPIPKPRVNLSAGTRILASAAVFAAVYAAALGVWSITEARAVKVIYYNNGAKNDMLVLGTRGVTVICDVSDGTYMPLKNALRLARSRQYAVKLNGYLLTHLHRRHVMQYMRMASRSFVDTLILPAPQTEAERYVAVDLEAAAKEYGSSVIYYDASADSQADLSPVSVMLPKRLYIKRSTHPVLAMYVSGGGAELLYLGGGNGDVPDGRKQLLEDWARSAKCIVFGAHSPAYYGLANSEPFSGPELAVYASAKVMEEYGINYTGGTEVVVLGESGYGSIELNFGER